MNFYLSGQAYFLQSEWLLTGWTLNGWMSAQSGMAERDYLAPLADPQLSGFRRAMTKYSDATAMTKALLCRLRVDVRATERDTDLAGIDPTLVFPETLGFWSEHSERGTMNTWMQMAGVPPEVRRMVGRWSVSQRDGGPTESGTDGSGRAGQQFGIWCFRAPNRRRNEEVPGAERCGGGNDPEAVGGDCAATLSAGSSQCGCFE